MKTKITFQISALEGEKILGLGETAAGAVCLAALASKDISFIKRVSEGYGVDYDKLTQTFKGRKEMVIARYERNVATMAGRPDEHFAEVFKVLHAETADIVLVIDSDTAKVTQYPRSYIQTAYEVFVLGKYKKGAPEVEALIAETAAAVPSN
jgi:hypothetical protein